MARTLLCLVRHGETNWNIERRMQGQLDIALNARGRAQAQALAQELSGAHFDCIYSSDLGRAMNTVAPLAEKLGLPVRATPTLREKHDGVWQGLTHAEVAALYPEDFARYKARRLDFEVEQGESLAHFAARARGALTEIARTHPGETVLIIAHAGVLDIGCRLATAKPLDAPRELPVINGAPNWIAYEDGRWSLVDWAREEGRAPVRAPWDGVELPLRRAARLLIVNPAGDVLLLRYSSRISPHFFTLGHEFFWGTPGGALEEGESFEDAARRELHEETGLTGARLGEVAATRAFPMQFGEAWVQSEERYFLVRAPAFDPRPQALTPQEQTYVLEWRWRSKDDIACARELIFPEGLAALMERLKL